VSTITSNVPTTATTQTQMRPMSTPAPARFVEPVRPLSLPPKAAAPVRKPRPITVLAYEPPRAVRVAQVLDEEFPERRLDVTPSRRSFAHERIPWTSRPASSSHFRHRLFVYSVSPQSLTLVRKIVLYVDSAACTIFTIIRSLLYNTFRSS
jgi:hypothetical protein